MNHPLGHKLKQGHPITAEMVFETAINFGLKLTLHGDEIRVKGRTEAIEELVPLLRMYKPELVRLLTVQSTGNDGKPAKTLTRAEWETLASAYQAHHAACPVCIAAGKGYGLRCGTGAALWAEYDRADQPPRTRAKK